MKKQNSKIDGDRKMNRILAKGIFLIIAFLSSLVLSAKQNPELPQQYEKWIKEEVVYIMTPKEKEVFFKLESDRERDLFIEEFWRQRDPTPGTQRNEFKDEHYRRIEYANKKFGRGIPFKGWRTDRGRFYIMLGRPSHVEKYSTADIHPIEIWYYHGNPKQGQVPYFRLVFFQRYGGGDYELYDPAADGPQSLVPFSHRQHMFAQRERPFRLETDEVNNPAETQLLDRLRNHLEKKDLDAYMLLRYNIGLDLAEASLSNFPGRRGPENILVSALLLRDVETYPHKRVEDDYAYEFLENKAFVEVNYSVHYIGNHSKVSIIKDPSGHFFVNYTLVPETVSVELFQEKYVTNLRTSIRMSNSRGKTVFQGGREIPIELREDELKMLENSSFHLCDSFPMIAGSFTLHFLLENLVTKEFTYFERNITVPEEKYLQLSPLILARKVNIDSPYSQSNRAFLVGSLQIYPSVNNIFLQKDTLFLFFQIYGLNQKLRDEGSLEITVYSGTQPYLKKRKKISDFGSERDFLEDFSLNKFLPGDYIVVVSLFDEHGQKRFFKRDTFSVTTKPLRGSWIVAQTNPPADDPYYYYILGNQFLNNGEFQKAREELAKAYEKMPDSLDYALSYTRVFMALKEYQKVREILMPFEREGKKIFGLFFTLGRASENVGEFKEAILFYQKALSQKGNIVVVLNSIGDCHYKLGNTEQAIQAWEKSLELNPDQEQLKKIIEQLKKDDYQYDEN
jgi:GWxTD domain-containing protein